MSMAPATQVERVADLPEEDLEALIAATDAAIVNGSGFGWLKAPPHRVLERYWRGVLLVPERELYIARLNGRVVGSGQLLKPSPHNEAAAHAAQLTTFFVAPAARGHGLARGLLRAIEDSARKHGFRQLDLDVRMTQTAAIRLYEEWGFKRWGVNERYTFIQGRFVPGYYYTKALDA